MGAFNSYAAMDRLESLAVQSSNKSQVSPMLQSTVGATQLYNGCQSNAAGAVPASTAGLTLPDGRLNVGTHLPLLAKRYKYLSTLGEGVSAQVLLVEDTYRPGHLVTVKVMKRQHMYTGHREVRALRFLHSKLPGGTPAPGIVRLLDTFTLGAHFCLVLERLHPRFLDWVAESAALPTLSASLPALRKLAYQLLITVAYLHSNGVVHADIKPDNLLLREPAGSPSVAVALVDLGGAFSTTETDMNTLLAEVQTLPYRAPEVALGLPCGAAVDEWSIGVVLAEAALKRPLFPCTSPMDLVQAMAAQLGPLPAEVVAASSLGQNYDLSSLVMPPPAVAAPAGMVGHDRVLPGGSANGMLPHSTLAEILGTAAASTTAGSLVSLSFTAAVPHALRQLDPLFADLIMGLLQYNPKKRVHAKQALLHPFFSTLSSLPAIFPELNADSILTTTLGQQQEQQRITKATTTHPSATIVAVDRPKRPVEALVVAPVAVSKRAGVHDSNELAASVVFGDAVESEGQAQHQQQRRTESQSGSGAAGTKGTDSAAKKARRERSGGGGSGAAAEIRSSKGKPWWVV